MCGIVGYTTEQTSEKDIKIIQNMSDIIKHRGPDGQGHYKDDHIVLGHRRLSLIDLKCGSQPMIKKSIALDSKLITPPSEDKDLPNWIEEQGRFSIVYNGEIYNYREIREELTDMGWIFETNSDTEVLLIGYIQWREHVLERLRGMFAFAIWDGIEQKLFLARDYFGIKPLYYCMTEDRNIIFSSEIKAILENPAYKKEFNQDALIQYLCYQFSVLDETFFKEIYKLPPASYMTYDFYNKTYQIKRWWRPSFYGKHEQYDRENEAVEGIKEAIADSVRAHNVADVEVGSFLSSGIDSSYLAASLSDINPSMKTFTVGFNEYVTSPECCSDIEHSEEVCEENSEQKTNQNSAFNCEHDSKNADTASKTTITEPGSERDEISWAKSLADEIGAENFSYHIEEKRYWDAVSDVIWHMEEPLGDPSAFALWFVDELASKHVKAVLSGEGADEFFGGYPIYQTVLENKKLAWIPNIFLKSAGNIMKSRNIRGGNYLLRASENVYDWYYTNAVGAAFTEEERKHVLSTKIIADKLVEKKTDANDLADFRKTGDKIINRDIYCSVDANELFIKPTCIARPVYDECAEYDEITHMQYVDILVWMVGDILLKTDKMSMAHSLESRVPFLDKEVFDVAARIPAHMRMNTTQTKIPLRRAAESVIPKNAAEKKKLGFPVPMREWMRKEEHYKKIKEKFHSAIAYKFFNVNVLEDILETHYRREKDNSRKIWIVYSFLVWYDLYFKNTEDIDYVGDSTE